ncbi:hypothetical protein O7626_39505 [Micromonospora sp. WMMD1102]|uniref:hypothetical protein n=1 Tax=Micromonospora sp. WMMD1102 TaxID=3016105 RepID=UPI002414D73E|nr:hypothetical protein [Micromonospora sp. WMMD1102]MDG4784399.1 hypothetical protein [Micromonospora sp. WMMD1102]MDG4791903.1 hypothetical protein [Micromonospora sp. WMMD1102]
MSEYDTAPSKPDFERIDVTTVEDLARGGRRYVPGRIVDQPPPRQPGEEPPMSIQALVRRDLVDREAVGRERYGTSLHAHNGRDALVDAYQEALDLVCYLRQAIEERP